MDLPHHASLCHCCSKNRRAVCVFANHPKTIASRPLSAHFPLRDAVHPQRHNSKGQNRTDERWAENVYPSALLIASIVVISITVIIITVIIITVIIIIAIILLKVRCVR